MTDSEYCAYCQRTADEIDLYAYQTLSYGPTTTVCADKSMSYDLDYDIDECDLDARDLAEMLAAAEEQATDPDAHPAHAAAAAMHVETLTARIALRGADL